MNQQHQRMPHQSGRIQQMCLQHQRMAYQPGRIRQFASTSMDPLSALQASSDALISVDDLQPCKFKRCAYNLIRGPISPAGFDRCAYNIIRGLQASPDEPISVDTHQPCIFEGCATTSVEPHQAATEAPKISADASKRLQICH